MHLYQNRNYLLLLLGLLLWQTTMLAQEPVQVERSRNKVILEGTVYYIHVVKPGETVYAISRAYNISQKEIIIENPTAISGLNFGQSLKIPIEPRMAEDIDTSETMVPGASGKKHKVKRGETLYSIAGKYKVEIEELMKLNKGVTPENLKTGQMLWIPEPRIEEQAEETQEGPGPAYDEEGYVKHRAKRRETIYSIAKYYEVTEDDIRAANPELEWGGLKNGQVIRIPLPEMTGQSGVLQDSLSDIVQFQLAQDSLVEEYIYQELHDMHDNIDRTYRVAFFIPFDFREAEPLDSLIKDVKSATRRNRIIERYMMEQKIPQSVHFLEFFQGTLLAIDSMRQTGMKLDVRYFDTRKSMDHTLATLMENDLEDFDLFVGPFYPYNLELVASYASNNRIPLVTPFYDQTGLTGSNPYLFQLSPSLEREYKEAAKLVASKHMYNIVYVRQEDSLDVGKHEYFKQLIFDGFDDYHPTEPVVFKEVIQTLNRTDEIIQSLSADKKNLVIVPTDDESLASPVVQSLFYQLKNYDIEVMGTPYWTEFSSIELTYFHKLGLIYFSSFWYDLNDPDIEAFMSAYRNRFYNEPGIATRKGINYGITGYDATLYFLNALRIYGPRFILSLDDYHPDLVLEPYIFDRLSRGGGYENTRINFYQFAPDMSISEIEVPEKPVKKMFFRPMEDRNRRKYLNLDPSWNE